MKLNKDILLITQANPSEVARAVDLPVAKGNPEALHIPPSDVAILPRPDFELETGFNLWRTLAGLLRLHGNSQPRRQVELAFKHAQPKEVSDVIFISEKIATRTYSGIIKVAPRERLQQSRPHRSTRETTGK